MPYDDSQAIWSNRYYYYRTPHLMVRRVLLVDLPEAKPDTISDREWFIVTERRKGTTWKRIANHLGVSSSRAQQILIHMVEKRGHRAIDLIPDSPGYATQYETWRPDDPEGGV